MNDQLNNLATQNALHILNNAPDCYLFLLPNAPDFTIIGATDAYLKLISLQREDIIGKSFFEVFTEDEKHNSPGYTSTITHSLNYVIEHKKAHTVKFRYDIKNSANSYEYKIWQKLNKPVLSSDDNLLLIINALTDVTERAQFKEEARLNKQEGDTHKNLLNHFFRQAPVAIAIFRGKEYIIELANAAHLEIWERTAHQVIGKPLFEAIPEAAGKGYGQLLDNVVQKKQTYHAYELYADLMRNGKTERVYFDFVYQPLIEPDSSVSGVIVIASEVTEKIASRKKADEAARLYKTLVEESTFAAGLYIGEEFKIEYVNNLMLGYWGRSKNVIGKKLLEALPELKGQLFPVLLQNVFSTGKPYVGIEQKAELMRDGKLRTGYFNFTYKPLYDADGKIYGIHNMSQEVTEQVIAKQKIFESERLLKNLILHAPIAICIISINNYTIEIANERMLTFIEKTTEEVIGKPAFKALPEFKNKGYEQLFDRIIKTGDAFSANGLPVTLYRSGILQVVYINLACEPVKEANGSISAVMVMVVDATRQVEAFKKIEDIVKEQTNELANANEALKQSNMDLEKSNKQLEEFTYAASHDLKEPIRKIHFFSDRIKNSLSGLLKPEDERYFERMNVAVSRMGSLIDDLLNYSRISLEHLPLEDIDLNTVIDLVLTDLDLEIENKKAIIKRGDLAIIKGYKRQLQQVFQNLIGNAIKYSTETPLIKISYLLLNVADQTKFPVLKKDEHQHFHQIKIADNGIGFDEAHAVQIFNMFVRLHGNSEYKGTGIGLAIVRKIIENHNGYVFANSIPGEGSVFTILLPA